MSNTAQLEMEKTFKTEKAAIEYCFKNLVKPSLMKGMPNNSNGEMYNLFSNYRNRYESHKKDPSKRGLGMKARQKILKYFGFKIETTYTFDDGKD